jgi:hypothetical protein
MAKTAKYSFRTRTYFTRTYLPRVLAGPTDTNVVVVSVTGELVAAQGYVDSFVMASIHVDQFDASQGHMDSFQAGAISNE